MEWNHFIIILLLDQYFKIKSSIYGGILGVLIKKSLNLILFPPIPHNFGGMKFEVLREQRGMSVPSYPFHSLLLKLSNKEMNFPFLPLKLPNKGMEEYSKIILFIPFHFIPFPPPKRGLRYYLTSSFLLRRQIVILL